MTFVEDIVLHSFQVRLRFSESVLEVLVLGIGFFAVLCGISISYNV